MVNKEFRFSPAPEPHKQRTREILSQHPEVRQLIGKNPYTFFIILALTGGMTVLSWLLADSAWWVIFLVAYFFGAFANHALFVMIHECSHNLLFRKKIFNTLASIIANLPHALPSAVSFTRYHLNHHSYQGVVELDADLPAEWEAKVFSYGFIGKAVWLLFFPFWQMSRIFRLKEIKPVDRWIVLNWVIQFLYDLAIWYFFGPKALLFLLFSFFFSVGLHPLGARWIQEHYLVLDQDQETYSYYGVLNTVAFNVGYHNEHHDLPSVPWNKLPQIKSIAPSFYNSLKAHKSWTVLFFRFLFDPSITLHSRMIRKERGKETVQF